MEDDDGAPLAKARALGLAYLNRRERTIAEVRSQLERRDVSAATAEAVVAELVDARLVDDDRFAEMFVTDKRELEQWGTQRIRRGLIARGIDRELAERALDEADRAAAARPGPASMWGGESPDETGDPNPDLPAGELGRALELLRRRFPEAPRDRRDRDRALGMLMRKGYESELALDAIAAHARAD